MPTYGDNTTSNSRYFQKGVFVDRCKIITVSDESNYPKKKDAEVKTSKSGKARELALKLVIDTGFEQEMWVFGKYNWKEDSISGKKIEYKGWKQRGNGVQNLLFKLFGEFSTDEFDAIKPQYLQRMPGMEFYRLRYCQTRENMYEGKPSFQNWNVFEKAEEGNDDKLYREWLKVAPNRSDYDPNLWEEYNEQQQAAADTQPDKEDAPF